MEMTFRDWSPVCRAKGFWSLEHHNPKLLHLFIVFQYFLGPRQHRTGSLFLPGSWRRRAANPSKHFLPLQENSELADPLDHLNVSSSCPGKSIKSTEESTLSSFDELVSQRILEILDSIICSQRFSTDQLLMFEQRIYPIKSGGLFVLIPLAAVH